MKKIGLWIDHEKAVIVTAANHGGEVQQVESHVDKIALTKHRAGAKTLAAPLAEDHRDRKFIEHLKKYYDEVAAFLKEAESIVIFGPGEAKLEFQRRLRGHELARHVVAVETTGRMTKPQIVAKVRKYFKD